MTFLFIKGASIFNLVDYIKIISIMTDTAHINKNSLGSSVIF